MLIYVIAGLVVAVAALLAFGIAALLHLQGAAYVLFVVILLAIGIAAAVVIVVMMRRAKRRKDEEAGGEVGGSELDLLLSDANRKLRTSQQGAKTLDALPLVYLLGEPGSAKTSTIVQSGLDPELVAGTASREYEQSPTPILNLWFTGSSALVELGAALRGNSAALGRLVSRTRPKVLRSAFGTGAAARAAIVCVSIDQFLAHDGGQSLLAAARTTNADLREISRMLGMPIPVYVIVTKLDRVPYFEQYVRNLADDEVRQVLGVTLPRNEASPGIYADQASRTLTSVIESIVYKLGEFRLEMLNRETDARNSCGVYEFPREFGKLRKSLNQYLVELCKPSQLSANPYLRGFYFTGIRARMIERAVTSPEPAAVPAMQEAGATQFLNLSRMRAESAARSAPPVMVAARVPQWTFLPRLLPEVILGDRSALAASTQSAPARLFRRVLYGSIALLLALYLVFLTVSYFHNAALEQRVQQAAETLGRSSAATAGLPELSALDNLRQCIVKLDDFNANGAPLSYRFGLYRGAALDARARSVYFDHFRPLLLAPAQQNFIAFLNSLPAAQASNSDFGAYLTAYNPLKAYLITTRYHDKSQPSFLTPVFLQYWMGTRTVDSDQQQLARQQIDFYGNELLHRPPYQIDPDSAVVEHARTYLKNFVAVTRFYQAMLSDADRKTTAVDFNRMYPGSAAYVVDAHVVRGAYTRDGFTLMQDAVQHPERYAQGDAWVLGDQTAQALNYAQMSKDLQALYTADFLREWQTFLHEARVGGCGSLREAPTRLNILAGGTSPLLELLFTVSHNTAVPDETISKTFKPAQDFVNPNATDHLIGGINEPYVKALSPLAATLDQYVQNPAAATDNNLFSSMVAPQLSNATAAVTNVSQSIAIDRQTHTEATIISLLKAPVECVARLAPSPGAAANGGGQKICAAIAPLLGKFPFAPNSTSQASMQEVDAVFQPDTGVLWTTYGALLKPYLTPQGAAMPAPPQPVNPHFAEYFRNAARVSSALYPAGQRSASFTYSLRFLPGNGIANASIIVDGQRTAVGGVAQQVTWNGAPAQHASLALDNNEVYAYEGPWAVFTLIRTGTKIAPLPGGHAYRVDFPINIAVAGHNVGTGAPRVVSFELTGPGADLLVPEGLTGLNCASPVVR